MVEGVEGVTVLIAFICLTLGLAIMAGSFYFGFRVALIKKVSDDNKVYLENMNDEIKRLEGFIETLAFEKDQLITDIKRGQENKTTESYGWNPSNPLDDTTR